MQETIQKSAEEERDMFKRLFQKVQLESLLRYQELEEIKITLKKLESSLSILNNMESTFSKIYMNLVMEDFDSYSKLANKVRLSRSKTYRTVIKLRELQLIE